MSELRVSAWKNYGHDRLYVNQPDGATVAWYDRKTGHVEIKVAELGDAALQALAPFLPAQSTAPSSPPDPPPVRPTLSPPPPEFDLALNKPGAAVRAQWKATAPGPLRRSAARLLGQKVEGDSWRRGLAGERTVARELRRLSRFGWRTLHSIQVTAKRDIDHLLIGPGGVFTINTKNHPGASVWVGDEAVKLNHRESYPYVARSRAEARHAARVLERGCGFPLDVKPLLVFVKPAGLDTASSLLDVRAMSEREVAALGPTTGVLDPERLEIVYAVARDQRNWTGA